MSLLWRQHAGRHACTIARIQTHLDAIRDVGQSDRSQWLAPGSWIPAFGDGMARCSTATGTCIAEGEMVPSRKRSIPIGRASCRVGKGSGNEVCEPRVVDAANWLAVSLSWALPTPYGDLRTVGRVCQRVDTHAVRWYRTVMTSVVLTSE